MAKIPYQNLCLSMSMATMAIPEFDQSLSSSIIIIPGISQEINLPPITDKDDDDYSIEVKIDKIATFITFDETSNTLINPRSITF